MSKPKSCRKCRNCKTEKPLIEFSTKQETGAYRMDCNECISKILIDPIKETKKCKICNQEKHISNFYISDRIIDGYYNKCKTCCHQYQIDNGEKISKRQKIYRENNVEKLKIQKQEYYFENKPTINQKQKEYYIENAEIIKSRSREYSKSPEGKMSKKKSSDKRKPKTKLYNAQYKQRDYVKEKRNRIHRERMKSDPNYVIEIRLRGRLRKFTVTENRCHSIEELVGCSQEFLFEHLRRQFTEGMTVEKIFSAEIQIDHIAPCCSFDLTILENQKKCFHYTNLRPLWALDNLSKAQQDRKLSIRNKKKIPIQDIAKELGLEDFI